MNHPSVLEGEWPSTIKVSMRCPKFFPLSPSTSGCFLIMLFCVLSEVKITPKYPKILWKMFNTIVPLFFWFQTSWITSKNNANMILGCWRKIINKGNIFTGLGKPPGPQNQCFSIYFNQEKSSNRVKYNYTSPRIIFGPIPGKKHGINQHFLLC